MKWVQNEVDENRIDHHQRGLIAAITNIQHDYMELIQASLHSHVSHTRCVEVLLVLGDAKEVKKLQNG